MNFLILRRFVPALLIIFLASACSAGSKTGELDPSRPTLKVFCSYPGSQYMPFFAWNGAGEISGFEPEVMSEVAEKLDLQIAYVAPPPGKTSDVDPRVRALQSGEADAVIYTMPRNGTYRDAVDFTIPYHVEGIGILVPNGSSIQSAGDLAGKRLLAFNGTTAYAWAKNRFPTARISTRYPPGARGNVIDLLVNGYIDAFLIDRSHLVWIASQSDAVRVLPEQRSHEEFAIAVKKGNDKLLAKLNSALVELHKDGTLRDLKQKWMKGAR